MMSTKNVVIALFIFSVILFIKYLLNSNSIGPIYFFDELTYKMNAESIFEHTTYYDLKYPPLYPFFISFAFFSKEHWYEWMVIINVILSSAVMIPLWLISVRFVSRKFAYVVILITALWSFNVYYPSLLVSENVYIPLFMFSIFLLVYTEKERKNMNMLINAVFGASLAMGYLTRYIHAVVIPVSLLLWWIKPLFYNENSNQNMFKGSRIIEFLVIVATFSIILVPWLVYASKSEVSILKAMGSEFISSGMPDFATLNSLMVWISFYSSYLILVLAPFMMILLIYLYVLITGRVHNDRRETFFFIAVVLFSCAFIVTSLQHSWRVPYNYPDPMRLMGRYLMPLMPLYFVAFMVILGKIRKVALRLTPLPVMICSLICLGSFLLSHYVLFSWPSPDLHFGFTNNPDVTAYGFGPLKYIVISSIVVITSILFIYPRNFNVTRNPLIIIAVFSLLITQAYSSISGIRSHAEKRMKYASHGNVLSEFLKDKMRISNEDILIVDDIPGVSAKRLLASLTFWLSSHMKDTDISVVSIREFVHDDLSGSARKVYLVTKDKYDRPLLSYSNGEQRYGVHILDNLMHDDLFASVKK